MAKFIYSAFADEADKMLSGQIRALKENGISLMEIRGVDGKSVADLTDGDVKNVRDTLSGEGIGLSALGSPYGKYPIDQPFEKHLDAFRRGLDIARALGADRVRMFSFYLPEGDKPENWRNKVIDQLNVMLDLADEAGVKLCHENERGIYGESGLCCLDLMQTLGDRMGCVFDPANFICGGFWPWEAFEKLEKYITYMHIKDAVMANRAIVPTGKGDGRVKDILAALNRRSGDMILTVEPHLTVFDGLKGLQKESLTHEFVYPSARAAFDAAVGALKETVRDISC